MDENYKQPIPTVPVSSTPANEEEIDLTELLGKLWHKRKFILKTTAIFLLVGLFIALFSPVEYTAQCVVVPQGKDNQQGGNLGGLASIVGVNIGTSIISEGVISPVMYPAIIKSFPFAEEMMETPITVKKSKDKPITLYEYYSDKKYRTFNIVSTIKKYTIGLPGTIISLFKPARITNATSLAKENNDSVPSIFVITPQKQAVCNAIKNAVQYEYNQKEKYITLGYTFPEPEAAAQIAEQLCKTLEEYVITYKTEKVKENLAFVERSYEEAKKEFFRKQTALAAFQDANRGLTTAMARTTEQQLRNEYNIAFTVYNELARQLEQAKLSVKETQPVFTVIDPVIVPLEKSAPRRGIILVVFVFLGLIIAIGWVFAAPFFNTLSREIKKQPADA
jgi:uncharacterized protein involved in exopolysaccharide biosynthesis